MKIKSDEELMREYADGNVEAFDELFHRYGQKIYNLFLRSLGNAEISQDLLQECFIRMTEARHRYQPRKAFSSWLITIAMNLLRDKYREKRRRETHLRFDNLGDESDQPADSDIEPQKILEHREMKEAVENALQDLPEEQRDIIILRKYHGLSFFEIGDILKTSPAAAKQKAYRGMQTLRKKLSYLKEG